MGLFDIFEKSFKVAGEFLSGIDAGDVVQGVTSVVGSKIAQEGNRKAQEIARDAEREATARESALIREGNAAAQERLDAQAALALPGQTALRRIVAADPNVLTPQQEEALADARRSTVNALNTSGLRGSGRATLSALRGVESDFRTGAGETNARLRQDAANRLAGTNTATNLRAATFDVAEGNRLGGVEGGGLRNVGAIESSIEPANAALRGQTLGDIAAIISSDEKKRRRSSRFATTPPPGATPQSGAVGLGGPV